MSLPALLQLASAGLPVGAFSHSLGLEAACAANWVEDADSAESWIEDYLGLLWVGGEATLWLAAYQAWERADDAAFAAVNTQLLAMRETAELRRESEQTGRSLALWHRALPGLPSLPPERAARLEQGPLAFASMHACAAQRLGLDPSDGLHALGWSLLENLIAAAVKLVPLGQIAGQAILRRLSTRLPAWVVAAQARDAGDAVNFAPMLGILSARHETQYTRLFRS